MNAYSLSRSLLLVVIGAAAYYALLGLSYAWAPYAAIPHWWREHILSGPAALASWFALINVLSALLSSLPVAIGLVIKAKDHALGFGMAIGVVAGLIISISGLAGYGPPANAMSWVTDAVQFLAVAAAISMSVAILRRLPLAQ